MLVFFGSICLLATFIDGFFEPTQPEVFLRRVLQFLRCSVIVGAASGAKSGCFFKGLHRCGDHLPSAAQGNWDVSSGSIGVLGHQNFGVSVKIHGFLVFEGSS